MDQSDLQHRIGERIKSIRTEKGIEQQELAAKIDYEKSNMSHIEAGRINITIWTLAKIADALKVSLSELLKDVEKNK